jgi:hypothetical protein
MKALAVALGDEQITVMMKAPPTEMILRAIVSVFKRGTRMSLMDIKEVNGDEQSLLGTLISSGTWSWSLSISFGQAPTCPQHGLPTMQGPTSFITLSAGAQTSCPYGGLAFFEVN